MGTASYIKGLLVATWSGIRHIFRPRMTLRYPEQKLDLEGPGYRFDPRQGVGLPGFKGRHILYMDKCTGCQLCAIACDGVAVAIEMQHLPKGKPQNKKEIWPAVDYGRCVPPWTPVTTSKGTLPIKEIRVGDRVLTHAGRFRKVTQVFYRKHTGRIYTFRTLGNQEPLTVTEGHPILVRRQEGLLWAMPDRIGIGDYLTRPIVREEQNSQSGHAHWLHHPEDLAWYGTNQRLRMGLGSSVVASSLYVGGTSELTVVQYGNAPEYPERGITVVDGMVLSPVVDVSTGDVEDFEVFNLEVEEDNTYVASNHVVHNCVFCGLCVDACPFDALFMTNDYELAGYDKESLKYSPDQLAIPPKLEGQTFKVKIDTEKGTAKHA